MKRYRRPLACAAAFAACAGLALGSGVGGDAHRAPRGRAPAPF